MPRLLLLSTVATLMLGVGAVAEQKEPALPSGRDPGGIAIALLGTGIDYTLPDIVRRLARDGEGELIGWDLVDNDNRPFRASGRAAPASALDSDSTPLARVTGATGRRLVPVKVDPANPVTFARAVAFVAQTPARIVVVPMGSRQPSDWEPFRQAASHFRDLLFIVAAGDDDRDIDREPVWPAAFGLANALVVSAHARPSATAGGAPNAGAGTIDALVVLTEDAASAGGFPPRSSLAAILAADALAGCWPRLVAAHRGEALKRAVLAEVAKPGAGRAKPVIERCTDDPAPATLRR